MFLTVLFQGKFHDAGKLYKKTGNDEKVSYFFNCISLEVEEWEWFLARYLYCTCPV